jgi:hypothetical protein
LEELSSSLEGHALERRRLNLDLEPSGFTHKWADALTYFSQRQADLVFDLVFNDS